MNARFAAKTILTASGYYRRRLRRHPYAGVAVLAYHGISSGTSNGHAVPFQQLHIPASRFEEHCRVLRDVCRPLTFEEWNRIAAGTMAIPPRAVLVTFDDGYRTVFTEALPVLERYNIPAVVFVCTDPIARGRQFWFDTLATRAGEEAVEHTKSLPWHEWRAIAAHDEPAHGGPLAPLSIDEVRRLAAHPLITIGSHSVTHPVFSHAPRDVQQREIEESRSTIESWIERPVTAFAYPNGRPRVDYTADTIRALAASGFQHGFAVGNQFARYEMSRFEQFRFLMLDAVSGPELAHRLALAWTRS